MRVKCLAQEHNAMSPARARTRTTRSGRERTKHAYEATAPPLTRRGVIINIIMHSQFRLVFQFAGIVFSCYLGVGFGLGSTIGGFLVDIIGGSWTFLLSGGVTAIVLVLCVLSLAITKLLNRMKNNKVERETEDYESS